MASKVFNPRFLLISLGNPAPYTDTLHSAGHHVLRELQSLLSPSQPAFRKTDAFGAACQASLGDKYLMLQCPTLMNVSGGFVAKAWQKALLKEDAANLQLVIVNDDLEMDLGVCKIRKWTSSHKGHNGVKSINRTLKMQDYPGAKWARISVGIGRPLSREKDAVSKYVLRPMTIDEMRGLENKAAPSVLECLEELEAQLAALAGK